MDTNILKEFLKIYNQLPCGVMIFKNEDLYFINNHLREILTLDKLDVKDSLNIVASMLQVSPSSAQLLDFFSNKSFFTYKKKYIQVCYKVYEEYKIVVLTKLNRTVLEEIFIDFKETVEITIPDIEEVTPEQDSSNSEILEYFEKHYNVKAMGIVLYKGVPLISENIILRTYGNSLVVKIEDKQMISSTIGTKWIIQTSKGIVFQAVIKAVNNDKKFIFLSNLKVIEDGYYKRGRIRYELNGSLPFEVYINKTKTKLDIVDISENSLKIVTDNTDAIKTLVDKKGTFEATIEIKNKIVNLRCRFLKKGKKYNKKTEIIFLFTLDENSKVVLNKWLNKQQIRAINEIRMFRDAPVTSK